jgi:hypothetical protein
MWTLKSIYCIRLAGHQIAFHLVVKSSSLLAGPTFLCLLTAVGLHLLLAGAQDSIAELSNPASYGLSLGLVALGLTFGVVALVPREGTS